MNLIANRIDNNATNPANDAIKDCTIPSPPRFPSPPALEISFLSVIDDDDVDDDDVNPNLRFRNSISSCNCTNSGNNLQKGFWVTLYSKLLDANFFF